ncbi:MAG: hypothetical protein NTW16_06740 [Bacteroidetes bacterium]|nr:hypothetical protein [Bacteroidota bacterium]
MNQVQIGPLHRSLPSSWNELSYSQLKQVCSLFNLKITTPYFKLSLLYKFLNIKKKHWNKISPVDAYFLCESLNFLLEDVTLTKALVKTIRSPRFPWIRYHGPGDGMAESTFAEYTKAQVRYEQYSLANDPQYLDELVAVLFRRKKYFWFIKRHFVETSDCRQRFFDRTLSKRAKSMSHIDPTIKKAILLYFSGIQKSLPEKFPNVYKARPDDKKDKKGSWSTLIISLADGKTDDQSLGRVMNSNLYNVFLGLEQRSIEYFEFLKKYPQND